MTNPKKLRCRGRRKRERKAAKKILQQNNILQVLPSHIIADITLRLPIKSIVHCMRVCVTWRNIILQPDFADLHLSTSPRFTEDTFLCYIMEDSKIFTLVPTETPTIARKNLARKNLLVFATPKQLPVLDGAYRSLYLDSPSANGLICMSSEDMGEGEGDVVRHTLYIYNPIIKEYAILPSPTSCSMLSYEEFAFGFCPKTSQYKLLRVVTTQTLKRKMLNRCEIYTLGTPAWREVSNVLRDELCDSISRGINCVFNGAIHIWTNRKHKGYVMVCFDLEIEEFVPFPQPLFATNRRLKHLGVLDNCLIATCSTEDMDSAGILELWMMQEYMREDSWTKKFEIDYSAQVDWDRFDEHDVYQHLKPIQLLSDGRLIVSYDGENIYFYDPQKRRLTKSVISDTSWLLHTPTFVSPKKVMGQILSNGDESTKDPASKRMRLC